MKVFRDFLLAILGPVLATLVIFYPYERQELADIFPNLALISIPQVVCWLLCCIIWLAVRKPVRIHRLLYGGIVGADLLLLFMIWPWFFGRPRDEMAWLFYFQYSWAAILAGGAICGIIGLLRRKA
jgi:hypothetical protein